MSSLSAYSLIYDSRASDASEVSSQGESLEQPCTGMVPSPSLPFPSVTDDLLSVIRGFRNGFVYGCKIRFPHALVMTLLFSNAPVDKQARTIFNKTREHSLNLGKYVALYKLCLAVVRRALVFVNLYSESAVMSNPIVHAMGGFLAGGFIWGQRTSVKHQINLYVLSRVIFGLARLSIKKGLSRDWSKEGAYYLFAAVNWALVMVLYEYESDTLSRSLKASMDYLYHNEVHLTGEDWAQKLIHFLTFTHH